MYRDQPDGSSQPFSVHGYMAENGDTHQEFLRNYDTVTSIPGPPSYADVISQGVAPFPPPGSGVVEEHIRQGDQSSSLRLYVPLVPGRNNSVAPLLAFPLEPPPAYNDIDNNAAASGGTANRNVVRSEAACNIEDEIRSTSSSTVPTNRPSSSNQILSVSHQADQNYPTKRPLRQTVQPAPQNDPPNRREPNQRQQTQQQPTPQRSTPAQPKPAEKLCWLHRQIIDLKIPSSKFVILVIVLVTISLAEIVVGAMGYVNCVARIPGILIAYGVILPFWIFSSIHCVRFKKNHGADSKLATLAWLLFLANIGVPIAGFVFVYSTFDVRTDPTSAFYCTDLPYFMALGIFTPVVVVLGFTLLSLILIFWIAPCFKDCFVECKTELKNNPKPKKPATEGMWLCRSIINLEVPSCKCVCIAVPVIVIALALVAVGAIFVGNCQEKITVPMIIFGSIFPFFIFGIAYSCRFKHNHGKPSRCNGIFVFLVIPAVIAFAFMTLTVYTSFDGHFDQTSELFCADLPYFLVFSFVTPFVAAFGSLVLYFIFLCLLPIFKECKKKS